MSYVNKSFKQYNSIQCCVSCCTLSSGCDGSTWHSMGASPLLGTGSMWLELPQQGRHEFPCYLFCHQSLKFCVCCWWTKANAELQLDNLTPSTLYMLACVQNLNLRGIDFSVDGQVTFCSLLLASLPANVSDGAVSIKDVYWILKLREKSFWVAFSGSSSTTLFTWHFVGLFSQKWVTKVSESAGGAWWHFASRNEWSRAELRWCRCSCSVYSRVKWWAGVDEAGLR